jgi:hypothetical protein
MTGSISPVVGSITFVFQYEEIQKEYLIPDQR